MARSIRRQALAWHALILALALAGFGGTLFTMVRASRLAEVDAELEGEARVLATRLRPPPPPGRRPGSPDRFGERDDFVPVRPRPGEPPHDAGRADGPLDGPPDRRRRRFGPGPDEPPREGPRLGPESPAEATFQGPDDEFDRPPRGRRPPVPMSVRLRNFELPEDYLRRFADADRPYFTVFGPDGEVLKTSHVGPRPTPPETDRDPSTAPEPREPGAPVLREVAVPGPEETRVVVGRPIGRELAELRRLSLWIIATAFGTLGLAVAGDVLISKRLVKPIDEISRAASAISATDLSRRIDARQTVAELEGLARTLNDAFARLEAAFRQQARFTADASHELRTPLAVLSSAAELALSRERSPAEYRASLEMCLRTARRMRSLVEALLTLARCDAGAISARRESVDLTRVAADAADLVEPLARERSIHVVRDLAPAWTYGDPAALGQVAANLIANAVRYNRDGGEVRVTSASERGDSVLRVSDTGIGIPAEHLGLIFERFHRVDAARSRDSGGTGLGLAIAKAVVEAHGGSIAIESDVDRGTTVTVRLPEEHDPPALPPGRAEGRTATARLG